MGLLRNGYKILVEHPEKKAHLKDIGVDEIVIIKMCLKEIMVILNLADSGWSPGIGSVTNLRAL
jgi:hypothetical protein